MADPSADLAMEYFKVGNAIVAFHVLQSIVFFNTLLSKAEVVAHITRVRAAAIGLAWVISSLYLLAIIGCGVIESGLRHGQAPFVTMSTCWAIGGRVAVVGVLTALSSAFIVVARARP